MSETTPTTTDGIQFKTHDQLVNQIAQVSLLRAMSYRSNPGFNQPINPNLATVRTPEEVSSLIASDDRYSRTSSGIEGQYNAYVNDLRTIRRMQHGDRDRAVQEDDEHATGDAVNREELMERAMNPAAMSVRVLEYINSGSRGQRGIDVFTEDEVASVRENPDTLHDIVTARLETDPEMILSGFGPLSFLLDRATVVATLERTVETNPQALIRNFWVVGNYLTADESRGLILDAVRHEHTASITFESIRYNRFGDIFTPEQLRSMIVELASSSTPYAFNTESIRDFLSMDLITTDDLQAIALRFAKNHDTNAYWMAQVYLLLDEQGRSELHDALVRALNTGNSFRLIQEVGSLSGILTNQEMRDAVTHNYEHRPSNLESIQGMAVIEEFMGQDLALAFLRAGIAERRGEFFGYGQLVNYIFTSRMLPVEERREYLNTLMQETPYALFEQNNFVSAVQLYDEVDRQAFVMQMNAIIPARVSIMYIDQWAQYTHFDDTELKLYVESIINGGDSFAFVAPFEAGRVRESVLTRLFSKDEILAHIETQRSKGAGDIGAYFESVIRILPTDQHKEFTAWAVVHSPAIYEMLYGLNKINTETGLFSPNEVEDLITKASSSYMRVGLILSAWNHWTDIVTPEFAYEYIQRWLPFAPDTIYHDLGRTTLRGVIPDEGLVTFAHRTVDLNPVSAIVDPEPLRGIIPGSNRTIVDVALARFYSDPFAPSSLAVMLTSLRSSDTDSPEYRAALRDASDIYRSLAVIKTSVPRSIEYLRLKQGASDVLAEEDLATATRLLVIQDTFGNDSSAAIDMGAFAGVDDLCTVVGQIVAKQIMQGGESKENARAQLFWDIVETPFYKKYVAQYLS